MWFNTRLLCLVISSYLIQPSKQNTMLINIIKSILVLYIICVIVVGYLLISDSNNRFSSEYELQLIDQNKVIIHSISSNKYITTTPDSIVYYLELDNL